MRQLGLPNRPLPVGRYTCRITWIQKPVRPIVIRKNKIEKIVIFGNSGSGKSYLAKMYSAKYDMAHLDLDTLAWLNTSPPERKPVDESALIIKKFMYENVKWVIDGCYSDLLSMVIKEANRIIFLNPGIETCVKNCKKRPWEPHKYASIEEQNKNLDMLMSWVRARVQKTCTYKLMI